MTNQNEMLSFLSQGYAVNQISNQNEASSSTFCLISPFLFSTHLIQLKKNSSIDGAKAVLMTHVTKRLFIILFYKWS